MDKQTPETTPVKLLPYLGAFSIWYMCALLALTGVSFGFGIGFGYLGNVAILVIAAVMTGVRFAEDNRREFAGAEKWKLGLLCLLASHVLAMVNTALVTLLFLDDAARENYFARLDAMRLDVWAFSILIVSFFYYIALVLFIGVGASNRVKKMRQGMES